MKVMLPSLALALLCLLRAGAEVPVQLDFKTEKFAGTWHLAAAASDCPVFLKMKDGMKSSTATVSFTPEGNLSMKLLWPMLDNCQKFDLLFQQSGQAGHYTGRSAPEKRDLRVVETDYSSFAIVYQSHQNGPEPSISLQLFLRAWDPSPELLQKFKQLFSSVGLTEDMMVILPKSGECKEGTGSMHGP
ncbi:LCN15 protein, partial [Crotophaga sulcirostris]|nr:LCN15 protein [Crotophaga sulcirostris]